MTSRPSPFSRMVAYKADGWRVLAEALVTLAVASLAIRLLPFRRTATLMAGGPPPSSSPSRLAEERIVNQCRWAVQAWADRVPWRAVCFQRGLALHWMLRRRGIASVLHYGIAQSGAEGLRAHVWVDIGAQTVIGGEEAPEFARVASFPASTKR